MDFKEAAQLINIIKPKFAIPVHYGSVVGSKTRCNRFYKVTVSNNQRDNFD